MNLIEELIKRGLANSDFHASGMLNVLECVKLETDEERIARCELYDGWKKYYKQSKEFKNEPSRKAAARKNAIAGLAVPELPMLVKKIVEGLNEEQWKEGYIAYLKKHSDILDWQADESADAAWDMVDDESPEEAAETELSYLAEG